MKDFCFRFVAEEGIKVDFIQASPTEVVFRVYRDDTTTTDAPNVNVSEKEAISETITKNEEAISETITKNEEVVSETITKNEEVVSEMTKKSTRHRIDKELFEKLWNEGVSGDIMADQLGITKNSVYNYAYKNGYGRRKAFKRISVKQLIPDKLAGKRERFVEMWNECIPIAKIADEFKVSVATVCRWASEIPECISSEEKKKKRAAMKQVAPVTTDDSTSIATAESLPQPKVSSSKEDWPKSGEHLRENEIKALCGMWHNGHRDVTELARHFQVSRSTIYYQMRVNGLKK